jgi:polyisoprenoid-binding protein YceI
MREETPVTIAEAVQSVPAGTWTSDPKHSSVQFSVVHNGLTPFRGGFEDFAATLNDGKLVGTAQVESITTEDENLTGHLLSPEFFDAERNPELRFESKEIRIEGGRVTADGELTLKGVTKPVELRGAIAGPISDAYGSTRLGLDLETTVDRTEFGIDWNAPLPSGENLLANDVKLTAHVQLVQEA